MQVAISQDSLHRTAKYFMDNGAVESPEAAIGLLHRFGLTIHVGTEIAHSPDHQIALLTLVNTASRTLLGGVEIIGLPNIPSISRLAPEGSLKDAVLALGGSIVSEATSNWPCAVIGTAESLDISAPVWQLTWEGWRAGVIPKRENKRLAERGAIAIAPALAAAICAAEAFSYHAGDHVMAGRRSSGMSLWHPGVDWQYTDVSEPTLSYLPSRLWLIGLGNLGQAFAWLLGCLPYPVEAHALLTLQDFDCITSANESTSLLTSSHDIGFKKTRVVAGWLEARGFNTTIEERNFGLQTQRTSEESGTALCGVDNALARAALEKAGFDLIVESGLGAGPQGFRNISIHTFPASRKAEDIWSDNTGISPDVEHLPAYQSLQQQGMDKCGLVQLASRTVAVPFVSVTAGCIVVSELLRRLHGGPAIEVASLSTLALQDAEIVLMEAPTYSSGYIRITH